MELQSTSDSAPLLLIDGYNVIHAAGLAPARGRPRALQRSREKLLSLLSQGLTRAEKTQAIVVFDARRRPPDRQSRYVQSGIRIHFATPHGDADLAIEQLLGETPWASITVVSSDRSVQQAARGRRAKVEDSHQFVSRLHGRLTSPQPAHRDPKEHGLSAAELAEWMRAFGAIDPAALDEPDAAKVPSQTAGKAAPTPPPSPKPPARARKPPQRKRPPPPSVPQPVDELRYWLSVFGHLDRVTLDDLS